MAGALSDDLPIQAGQAGPPSRAWSSTSFGDEYGRLVATLARAAGLRHVELVEDAVQTAFIRALTAWTAKGLPQDPGGWLYRVAYNHLVGELRRERPAPALDAGTSGERAAKRRPRRRISAGEVQ